MLCSCPCHADCPLAGRRQVEQDVWAQRCTCLGAVSRRAIYQRVHAEHEQRRHVLADVDVGRGQSPEQIQRRLLRAFAEHGEDPQTDFSRTSRFVSAATARYGTRTVRLVSETVRGLAAARRYSDRLAQPAAATVTPATLVHRNEARAASPRSLRRLLSTVLASATLTATAVVAARRTRGPLRGALVLVASGVAAFSAWTALIAAVLSFFSRPPHRDPRRPA